MMIARAAIAASALLLLCGQDDLALKPLEPNIDAICTAVVKDRTELMDQCREEEMLAFEFVLGWLAQNGLLTPEGAVDAFAMLEAEADPLRAMHENAASAASFCFQTAGEWIALQQCLTVLDPAGPFGAPGGGGPLDPFGGIPDPQTGPLYGN